MAISTPTRSSQFTDDLYSLKNPVTPGTQVFMLQAVLTFTAAGFTSAAAADIALLRLPAGNIRILRDLSFLKCPVGTATSDLDVGLQAYTKADGTTQAVQGIALADSLDVGGAALEQVLPLPAGDGGSLLVNSAFGVVVACSFDTANSPAAGTLILKLAYQREPL